VATREHPTSDPRQKLGPRPVRVIAPAAPRAEPIPLTAQQAQVLADIRHDLGNYFHKLFYWAEYLRDAPEPTTAADMLAATVRELEGFLKVALDYFDPSSLNPMQMTVADLVGGLNCQLRNQCGSAPLQQADMETWRTAQVSIDPSRLSYAFETAVRQFVRYLRPESRIAIGLEGRRVRSGGVVDVAFVLTPAGAGTSSATALAEIEWAIAERVIVLHGGELRTDAPSPDARRLVLTLPLHI